jgi:hypothetical protein
MGEIGKIYGALAKIMRFAKAIGKDSQNSQQGFRFRGIDAVMNNLHPLFADAGVVILPNVLEDRVEERQTKSGGNLIYRVLKIRFDFAAEDGSMASATVIGEGMDSGDKASNKAMAVALKYALTQLLLLPYDEVDPDAETPPPSERKAAAIKVIQDMPQDARETFSRPAPVPSARTLPDNHGAPSAPKGLRDPEAPATEPQRKKLFAMCKAQGWSDSEMKAFSKENTGKESSKDLTMAEIQKLFSILDALQGKAREPGQDG